MRRQPRADASDLLALTLGFVLSSSALTVVSAARRAEVGTPTALTVALLTPANGQALSGAVVVSATTGTDTEALQFQVGGANLGPQVTSGECSTTWDTTTVNDGSYGVTVVAFDANGNSTTSTPATVTVQNTVLEISSVQATAVLANSAMANWFTNQPASSGVDYGQTGYSASLLDGTLVTQHSMPIAGLSPGTSYHFRVSSRNAAGLLTTSADAVFTTPGSGSKLPPPGVPNPTPTPTPTPTPGPAAGTIVGNVLDSSGQPRAGIDVLLIQGTSLIAMTKTDAAGRFQFNNVPPGTYQAVAVAVGFVQVYTFTVPSGGGG